MHPHLDLNLTTASDLHIICYEYKYLSGIRSSYRFSLKLQSQRYSPMVRKDEPLLSLSHNVLLRVLDRSDDK
jgi:hypothetical protein